MSSKSSNLWIAVQKLCSPKCCILVVENKKTRIMCIQVLLIHVVSPQTLHCLYHPIYHRSVTEIWDHQQSTPYETAYLNRTHFAPLLHADTDLYADLYARNQDVCASRYDLFTVALNTSSVCDSNILQSNLSTVGEMSPCSKQIFVAVQWL